MKKLLVLLSLIYSVSLISANIQLNDNNFTGYDLKSSSSSGFEIEVSIGEIDYANVKTEKGEFVQIGFSKSKYTNAVGAPKLPVLRELIEFPAESKPVATVISYKTREIMLNEYGIAKKIIPAQPGYSKSTPQSEIKFVFDPQSYKIDNFSETPIAAISKSGNMRGVDIGVLEIRPVFYNPVKNSIKVYTDIKIKIEFTNFKSDIQTAKAEHYSPFFENQFRSFLNSRPLDSKTDLTQFPVTYLIAVNEVLKNNAKLDEFIAWKTQKGFSVITEYFSSTATTSDVDTWVENKYQTLSPKPTFLLIIGDQSGTYKMPTETNPALGAAGSVTVSDLLYSVMGPTSAENRIPSIYVGRFSVNTLADLDAQIDKTIWYEKTQFTSGADLTYLSRVMGVAGVDASYGEDYGNPQIKYGMTWYFNRGYNLPIDGSDVDITGIPFYYPASAGSTVDAAVVSEISTGVSFYNYTAHGSQTSFGDPTFTVSNVDNLTNAGKYPLVVGNCCLTGSFGYFSESFGESWLNAPNKGGIGFIGASMSTYWDEDLAMGVGTADVVGNDNPPLSQDKPGMYDGAMMMNYPTQGAIRFIGLMAVEELNSGMTSSYWSSYHLFGDPSLMVHFGIPGDNTVDHDPVITPGLTYFTVQALKGSYVGITDDDGVLHGAGVADEFGYAVITIEPFLSGNANITVTSQFKKPYFNTIPVEELTSAYLKLNTYSISSTNFASDGTIDLELKNIGVLTSEGISVTASSLSEYITFSDSQEFFANIAASDSLLKNSVFSYSISSQVPDGEEIMIELTINDTSKRTYTDYIIFKAGSPDLSFSESFVGDEINPGDSKDITIKITNSGSGSLSNITASLTETTGADVTISGSQIITSISGGGTYDIVFTVDFASGIPNGSGLKFDLNLTAESGYENSYLFNLSVGMTDNFETGDFSANPWYFEGNADWSIDNTVFYSGTYSSKSGLITHNQTTSMKVDFIFSEDGTVSFYKKVSSESGYDKLMFYIDGESKATWSGEATWSYHSYPVAAGTHTMTWTYLKDVSDTVGLDCAWIDNILATGALSGIEEETMSVPLNPVLFQNYPNPFNPTTTIRFSIPNEEIVKLNVFNSNGQLVENLINGKTGKGYHEVKFNAESMNSGIYFYSLEISGKTFTNKMLLIK